MPTIIALFITLIIVGVFLYRENKKSKGAQSQATTAGRTSVPQVGKGPQRDWSKIVADAKAQAAGMVKPATALVMTQDPNASDPHSCIGGQPSLPEGQDWPRDANQKPMIFLAQINFAEIPSPEGYPTQGLFSVFVMDDDLNGCDFPSIGNKGFAVFYFEDTAKLERAPFPDVTWEFPPLSDKLLKEGRRVTGAPQKGTLSSNSAEIATITQGWYPDCPNALWDELWDSLNEAKISACYFGGHPDFTQDDFRRAGQTPDYTNYTEVLLQLGFHHGDEKGIEVCWGDAGEACFLSTKEDLADRRFDRVAYNWDCS